MAATRDWLSGVYEIAKDISAVLDVDEILGLVARETQRLVRFDDVVAGLLEDRGQRLRLTVPLAPEAGATPGEFALRRDDGHILGHVVRSRQTLRVADVPADERFAADPELVARGAGSCVAIPLTSGDKAIGALALMRRAVAPFNDLEVEILEEVAERTAVAIDHARLYATEKKRANHLAIINKVARQALATFELGTLLRQTVSLIQHHFAYYDVAIFMVDKQTDEVILRAQAGAYSDATVVGYRQAVGVGMVGWAAKTGQTLLASDVTQNPHYIVAFEGERASRSELCVPIRIGGQTAGVINIECPTVGAFDQTDVTAIQTLSDQVAQAIENARLYDEMRYLKELDESILASIPSSILVLDRALSVMSVNATCCRVLDRPREAIIGESFESLFQFDSLAATAFRRTIERVVDEDQRASFAATHIALAGGRERIADIHLSPVARRAQRRALVFIHDITERRQAQERALHEKQKLDEIVSAMGAGLVLIEPDFSISWSNNAVDQWFGEGETLVGQLCHLICRNSTEICPDCPVAATFATGETHRTEQTVVSDHRGRRYYQNIFAPLDDEEGRVVQVLRLTSDVTEHAHRVEQVSLLQKLGHAMQGTLELDRLLHLILTCVTAGPGLGFNRAILLLIDDTHTVLEGRLGVGPSSSEEAARIWRELSKGEQTIDGLLELFDQPLSPGDAPMQYLSQRIRVPLSAGDQVLIRALREKRPIVVADADADPGVPPDLNTLLGTKQFVCAPLVARDVALGAIIADKVFTAQPITREEVGMLETFAAHAGAAISAARAYRRLEEQLNEIEEAQDRLVRSERLATVGRLAAHVAHEIRNPLVTIGGFARSILRAPSRLPRVERNARIILEEVERLEQILANVMNFTKPGNPVLHDRSINELVEAVCAFHEDVFAERGVVLHKSTDADCPTLRFDPNQIRQVLINIIQNALDSMPEGGEITILTRAQIDHVEIVVADTGHGMPPDVLDNLFQPFYTTKVGGTGLGLSVSQKIVHDHGGDITVRSKPDAGSSFTVALPIPDEAQPENSGDPSCPPS